SGMEGWVVNDIVAHGVDVRVNHQPGNEAENQHHPERRVRVQKEQPQKIGEMEKAGRRRQHVPARVREKSRVSRGSFSADCVSVHGGGYHSPKTSFLASCSLPMSRSHA